jgi:S-adenosylmethionine:tRNA-ribosyltransferase-isomerase (queuine synthetase)
MSPEEILANLKANQARIAEENSEALQALKARQKLTDEQMQAIEDILELRKCNILNLTGIIDEFVAMPCNSTQAKFNDATKRYGRLV